MRDYLLANKKPRSDWKLKDAKTTITNSTWERDAVSSGEYLENIGDDGVIGKPGGMAFDLEGNLLVADFHTNRSCIRIFDRKTGTYLGQVGNDPASPDCTPAVKPACCFESPRDVKFNPNDGAAGQLVVCDTGNNRVVIMDYATGETVRIIDGVNPTAAPGVPGVPGAPAPSPDDAQFTTPVSISIGRFTTSNTTNTTLIAIYCCYAEGLKCIKLFDFVTGIYSDTYKLESGDYKAGVFNGVVAFDVDNNLIITDPTDPNHRNKIILVPIKIIDSKITIKPISIITEPTIENNNINGICIIGSRLIVSSVSSVTTPPTAKTETKLLAFEYIIPNTIDDITEITVSKAPEYENGIVKTIPDKAITDVAAYSDGAIFVSNATDEYIMVYADKKAEIAKSLKPLDRTADYSDAGKAAYEVKIADATKKLGSAVVDVDIGQFEKELAAANSGKAFYESRERGLAAANAVKDANAQVDEAKKNVTRKLEMFMGDAEKNVKKQAIAKLEALEETAKHAKGFASSASADANKAQVDARKTALSAEQGAAAKTGELVSPKSSNLQSELQSGKHIDAAMTQPQHTVTPKYTVNGLFVSEQDEKDDLKKGAMKETMA